MNPQRAILAGLLAAGLLFAGSASAGEASRAPAREQAAKPQFRITHVTPEYWRVTIDNPPFNIFGPESIPQLNAIVSALEVDPKVKVVVFDSAVPNFFLTHYDFERPLSETTGMAPGPTGLAPLPDILVRLSRAPVVSIVSIRGRASGVGSELALASDMRFASLQKAVLSQWEIGAGLVPGGGPISRLPRLMGRGRALEVLLSGDDIDGELAQKYGYVNRSLQDAELDAFVDKLARRIASFDKQAIIDIKGLVNKSTLPSDAEIGAEWNGYITSAGRPQAQRRIKDLMGLGLQQENDVERRLADYTGNYAERVK